MSTQTLEKCDIKLQPPKMKEVFILNDDYTSEEFVVKVLNGVFLKSPEESITIMTKAHKIGQALVGIYPPDIAETKVKVCSDFATSEGYPFELLTQDN